MSTRALAGLATLLLLWAFANTFVVNKVHRTRELYPMTAWQMFSGRPKEFVRHFEFAIVPIEGQAAATIEGSFLVVGKKSRSTKVRKVLESIWRSKMKGCPDYRIRDYRDCRDNYGISPWIMPEDIAQRWLDLSMRHLDLEQPPFSITLINVERPVDLGAEGERLPDARTPVLQWKPASGRAVETLP